MKKKCLSCGSDLYGRIDKKFCSDNCRNKYHNSLNVNENRYIRKVNYILRRNRRILLDFDLSGVEVVTRNNLIYAGFNFNFITGVHDNDRGETCYFCYDHGYIINREGNLTLIKRGFCENTNPVISDNTC